VSLQPTSHNVTFYTSGRNNTRKYPNWQGRNKNWVQLFDACTPKIWEGKKRPKFGAILDKLGTLIANIPGTDGGIKNWKACDQPQPLTR